MTPTTSTLEMIQMEEVQAMILMIMMMMLKEKLLMEPLINLRSQNLVKRKRNDLGKSEWMLK